MDYTLGVRFKPCTPLYYFSACEENIKQGDWVVAESEMGIYIGRVLKVEVLQEVEKKPTKPIIRIAAPEDFQQQQNNKELEKDALEFCEVEIKKHQLPMKLVGTESTLDRRRLLFYFTAERRVDFRELVKVLASRFKTRIEMRQIGVRDAVKFIGGIGMCGRETCCQLFLCKFEPVSIRMAKKQEMILAPGKLSGLCGRLLCCIGFEDDDEALCPIREYEMNQKFLLCDELPDEEI